MLKNRSVVRQSKWVEVALHFASWALFLILPYLLRSNHRIEPDRAMRMQPPRPGNMPANFPGHGHYQPLILNILMIPLFYLNTTWLVPKYFLKRRYVAFAAIQCGIMVTLHYVDRFIHHLLSSHSPGMKFGLPTFLYLLVTSLAVCYCLVRQNLDNEKKQKEKENENLKSELLFLRWQISPHFMFNALNNMVALSRTKSDKLEPLLIKLSTLMRYMLYDTDERKVPIQKEAEYLQSYIDLQTIRFGSELKMVTEIDIDTDAGVMIEPMLLIPFVENAFKHGTGTVARPFIHLIMNVSDKHLEFSIRNRYTPGQLVSDDQTHGIGLANVSRRLNLLYADNFTLNVERGEEWFLVILNIDFR